MSDETLFESEGEATGAETATMLRELADALEDGTPIELADGERSVAIDAPADLVVEVELEREPGDDGDEVELELELEWTAEGGAAVSDTEGEERADETAAAEEGAESTDDTGSGSDDEGESATETAAGAESDTAATPEITAGGESQSMARFQVFRDRADEWRWRLVHRNGNVIATSGEGYTTRRNAEKGLGSVVKNAPGADVEDEF